MFRFNLFLLFIIFYLLSLSGCQENKNNKEEQQINNLQERVSNLQSRVFDLEVKMREADYETISLDFSSKNYQRVDTSTGIFLILPKDIQPYVGGYKIILSIGNPSSATYNGFSLKVKWNKRFDVAAEVHNVAGNKSAQERQKAFDIAYKEWKKSVQEKEFSFPDTLNPGSWNDVELIISPATPEQLGYFELSMNTDTISLNRSSK